MWLKKDVLTKRDKEDFKIAIVVIVVFSVLVYKLLYRGTEEAVVDFEKDFKIEELNNDLEKLAFIETNNLPRLTIKAEDAYEVGVDSAVVVCDVKNAGFLGQDKVLKSNSIEKEVTKVLEVKTAVMPEHNDSLKETTEAFSDELGEIEDTLELNKGTRESSEPEFDVNVESSKIIDKVSSSLDVNIDKIEKSVPTIKEVEVVKEQEEVIAKEKVIIKESLSAEPEEIIQRNVEVNDNYDCVIVVGAFKEIANKNVIIKKLTSLGYAHSEGVLRKGLNYVGVPVGCNDKQEKQKLLSELNEAFGIDSWVKRK